MTSLRKAQTGKRTYRFGTSTSPNKGPVSAQGKQGYRERSMRQMHTPPIKNTGFNNGGRPIVPQPPFSTGFNQVHPGGGNGGNGLAGGVSNGGRGGRGGRGGWGGRGEVMGVEVMEAFRLT
jgi:hypothetical protein